MPRSTAINRLLHEDKTNFSFIMDIKLEFGEDIESFQEKKSAFSVFWSHQDHFLRVWNN
jgi:hypothetical protein